MNIMSFFLKVRIIHKLMNILESYGSLLNNEKGVGFEFLKNNSILCVQIFQRIMTFFYIGYLKSLQLDL